ncbi:MAG TPA: hypothetical protein VNS09_02700 [Solirubrobacter sp.]|nr:hypothetical protein [Solirubrobacter sp.]
MSIAAGVNAHALCRYMGHSSIAMTFDLYGHSSRATSLRPPPSWTRISNKCSYRPRESDRLAVMKKREDLTGVEAPR